MRIIKFHANPLIMYIIQSRAFRELSWNMYKRQKINLIYIKYLYQTFVKLSYMWNTFQVIISLLRFLSYHLSIFLFLNYTIKSIKYDSRNIMIPQYQYINLITLCMPLYLQLLYHVYCAIDRRP